VVAPRVAEVVATHLGASLPGGCESPLLVVDDETEMPVVVGGLAAALGERDELVADVDEGHAVPASA
jgi:hypothetical protein